ncbi:hypothetical protein ACFX13_005824 [Malus domestica]
MQTYNTTIHTRNPKKPKLKTNRTAKGSKTHIRGIADELTEKDLIVAVEGVDGQTQKLVDLAYKDFLKI